MPSYTKLVPPAGGGRITLRNGALAVPDNPIIPFIEGDGTGPDIWRASRMVFDAAVARAYGGRRKIAWFEILAGEKAFEQTGSWLPEETVEAIDRMSLMATDAVLAFLRARSDIAGDRVALLGHSEGARVAMWAAAEDGST
jgi:pimeloyl-ACP methyl ester carboxylesterase